MAGEQEIIDNFIAEWALPGGSEPANKQSFVYGLSALIGLDAPNSQQVQLRRIPSL